MRKPKPFGPMFPKPQKRIKKHSRRRSRVLKLTTNRREHHILYDRLIHGDCCFICSKRVGKWVDCWKSNDNEYDNPVKSWKYKNKKRKQWMYSKGSPKKSFWKAITITYQATG